MFTGELYQDKAGEFRWRLRHRNGRIVAESGEGYSTMGNAKRAYKRLFDDQEWSLDVSKD